MIGNWSLRLPGQGNCKTTLCRTLCRGQNRAPGTFRKPTPTPTCRQLSHHPSLLARRPFSIISMQSARRSRVSGAVSLRELQNYLRCLGEWLKQAMPSQVLPIPWQSVLQLVPCGSDEISHKRQNTAIVTRTITMRKNPHTNKTFEPNDLAGPAS